MIENLFESLYLIVVVTLSIYGLLGFFTLGLFLRYKNDIDSDPPLIPSRLPTVTVQIPIYNERFVIEQVIDAVIGLDYPHDRLQIQVIDDSDDDTVKIAHSRIAYYQSLGVDIEHLRRSERLGYKAGALAKALPNATGDYVAIFDADFHPMSDFLLKTIPYFIEDPQLGMVQARWGHLNSSFSALTAAQSIALDKHFRMEQRVRHKANMFPKFNGTAGIWRRECVDDAGGWKSDTLCEDLCLSTRAILRGWKFRYIDGVVVPAELPTNIQAYKNQQARWAKGSTQCLKKYGGRILTDTNHKLSGRIYALLSMSAYGTSLLLLILILIQLPMILLEIELPSMLYILTLVGLGQPILFILAQYLTYPDWGRRILYFPVLLMVAVGMAPTNAGATLQAMFSSQSHSFVRTPKGSGVARALNMHYRNPTDGTFWFEIGLTIYSGASIVVALVMGQSGPLIFLLISFFGFAYVSLLEIRERHVARYLLSNNTSLSG